MDFFTSLEGTLALSSLLVTFGTVLFSISRIWATKILKEDKGKDKIDVLGDSNIVLNQKTNQITIKDKNEKIDSNEIKIENIKPTEIYINNNYSNYEGDKGELGRRILGDKILSFENEHLSNYYKQTLYQSQISFWVSLIFASIGFALIIVASVIHVAGAWDKTVISIVSGVIIDAIAALFFVQSNNAQKAVGTFFEKLRKDKQIHDAIKMSETIENADLKDNLKVKISLSLLGIANSDETADKLIDTISSKKQ
jgi:hypothetical protein